MVSHMDSRDKHRVRGCCVLVGGLKGVPVYTPCRVGASQLNGSGLVPVPRGLQTAMQGDTDWKGPVFPGAWGGASWQPWACPAAHSHCPFQSLLAMVPAQFRG